MKGEIKMNFLNYVKMKTGEKKGLSYDISLAGWCVIATLVVAAVILVFPDLVTDLIEKIFDNFDAKLGL